MLSITIPLWLMLTAAGVPTLLLFWLVIRLARIKRKKAGRLAVPPPMASERRPRIDFNDQIHQQLLQQQIDAIFNVLVTVIETERIKLKALAAHSVPATEPAAKLSAAFVANHFGAAGEGDDASQHGNASISQNIVALSENGLAPDEIARRLGLSQAEITLAMKMKNLRTSRSGNRMQAVA